MLKKVSSIFQNARSITIEIEDEGIFHTKREYEIYVNDRLYKKTDRVVTGIYGLEPSTKYEICVKAGEEQAFALVTTRSL